jgi:hypothetical protein
MYRVIDLPGLFSRLEGHNFGSVSLRLRLTITDNFIPENSVALWLSFVEGILQSTEAGEEEVGIDLAISEFSSMIVGAVSFRELYDYGLAQTSDPRYVDVVDSLFKLDVKPVCLTRF